jgi:hypothetical protein
VGFTALINSKGLNLFNIINPEIITQDVSTKSPLALFWAESPRQLSWGDWWPGILQNLPYHLAPASPSRASCCYRWTLASQSTC